MIVFVGFDLLTRRSLTSEDGWSIPSRLPHCTLMVSGKMTKKLFCVNLPMPYRNFELRSD